MKPAAPVVPMSMAILAGAGQFPFHVAQEAKRRGISMMGFGIQGWADPSLASHVNHYEEIAIGQLGHFIGRLKAHRVRQLIMAGKVTKEVLLTQRATFDAETLGIVMRAGGNLSAPALLGAVGKRLAKEGITLLDSSMFLKEQLCPVGVLTTRRPTTQEERDIRLGWNAARTMASLDVGQSVVVKHGVVIAVEALEGTDAAIRRAHALAGAGCIVVKTGAPQQDRRFDLPIIGPTTIDTLRESEVTVLAIEAKTTLLLDRHAVIAAANDARLAIVGIKPDG